MSNLSRSRAAMAASLSAFDDDGLLVLNSDAPDLPSLCLKTGVPTNDLFHLEDPFFLNRSTVIWAYVLGRAIGLGIVKGICGVPIDIELPLSKDWIREQKQKMNPGWIAVGIGTVFLGVGLYLAIYNSIYLLVGVLVFVTALVETYLIDQRRSVPFVVIRIKENWIWIKGVNPEVVSCFPVLPFEGPPTIDN